MIANFTGRTALITGATRGLGLHTALALGRRGARCILTYAWGGEEEAVLASFDRAGASPPLLVCADVSADDDTAALLKAVAREHDGIDVFVSNVAFGRPEWDLERIERRDLLRAVDYSAWPLVGYTRAIHATFGRYPKHIIGLSSLGAERYHPGYDTVGSAKAALEVLARYLGHRLAPAGVRVNVVRARWVETQSLRAVLRDAAIPYLAERALLQPPDEVAAAVVALCSGLMDGMNGQILTVDGGGDFFDNLMHLHAEAHAGEQEL